MIETGELFGKYTLLERLAIGGMAEIFKASCLDAEGQPCLVAIKRLHAHLSEQEDFSELLADEARIAIQLTHPNIGQVFDLGVHRGQYYLVMEFIDGIDLHRITKALRKSGASLPLQAALHVVTEVCEALHYAHTRLDETRQPMGIVHRDVSPQNVMVTTDGLVKLVDFGIAKARVRAQHTEAGIIKGKFFYMAPEQALGHHVDARTDVFAMSIVLYELLAGRNPYEGISDVDLLKTVRLANFEPLSRHVPDLNPELARIIERGLARDREQRTVSALELGRELRNFTQRHCPPFGAPELGRLARKLRQRQAPQGGASLHRNGYQSSEESLIFAADSATAMHVWDAQNTRVFDRAPDEPDSEEGPRYETAIVELGERSAVPGFAGPLLAGYDPQRINGLERMYAALQDRLGVQRAMYLVVALAAAVAMLGLFALNAALAPPAPPSTPPLAPRPVQAPPAPSVLAPLAPVMPAPAPSPPGDPSALRVRLALSSNPANAQVYVDGELIGTTPVAMEGAQVGRTYAVQFRRRGYASRDMQVSVQANQEPVVAELLPMQGVLKVNSYPAGAQILVNAQSLGAAPVTATGLSMDTVHTIEASFRNGQSMVRTVEWGEGEERIKEIQFDFEAPPVAAGRPVTVEKVVARPEDAAPRRDPSAVPPSRSQRRQAGQKSDKLLNIWNIAEDKLPGTLYVRIEGADGRVFIDGQPLGMAPVNAHSIAPGTYEIHAHLTALKRNSAREKVTIVSGRASRVVLKP